MGDGHQVNWPIVQERRLPPQVRVRQLDRHMSAQTRALGAVFGVRRGVRYARSAAVHAVVVAR